MRGFRFTLNKKKTHKCIGNRIFCRSPISILAQIFEQQTPAFKSETTISIYGFLAISSFLKSSLVKKKNFALHEGFKFHLKSIFQHLALFSCK